MSSRVGNFVIAKRNSFVFVPFILCVFAFTATCTFIFFSTYAPPDLPWIPFVAFAFYEGGFFVWKHMHRHGAENPWQHNISQIMTYVSIAAVLSATVIMLVTWFHKSGVVSLAPIFEGAAFWSVPAIIALDILAIALWELLSPEHVTRSQRMKQVQDHESYSQIVWVRADQPKSIDAPTTDQLQSIDTSLASREENRVSIKKGSRGVPQATSNTP